MSFAVGQKIVCVNDGSKYETSTPLKVGAKYTVTAAFFCDALGFWGVLLSEVECPKPHIGFWSELFRPLEEKPDTIEIFRAIAAGGDVRPGGDQHDVRSPAFIDADIFENGRPILSLSAVSSIGNSPGRISCFPGQERRGHLPEFLGAGGGKPRLGFSQALQYSNDKFAGGIV